MKSRRGTQKEGGRQRKKMMMQVEQKEERESPDSRRRRYPLYSRSTGLGSQGLGVGRRRSRLLFFPESMCAAAQSSYTT